MTKHRRLATKIAEVYLVALQAVGPFAAILDATDPEIMEEFTDGLIDVAEAALLIEWPHATTNGWHEEHDDTDL